MSQKEPYDPAYFAEKSLAYVHGVDSYGYVGKRRWSIIDRSAVAASVTGTASETTLKTVSIPILGANDGLRITTLWSVTSSTNAKDCRVKLGGTAFAHHLINTTGVIALKVVTNIVNRNNVAIQVGDSDNGVYGQLTGALLTGTVNTAVATSLTITGQLANTGETITLESYLVELLQL